MISRCWNERGIGVGSRDSLNKDLNATALGFRALRLHRYKVSSGRSCNGVYPSIDRSTAKWDDFDLILTLYYVLLWTGVFDNFKDGNRQFFCSSIVEERAEAYNKHVRCMLSLLRASDISFPGENVMAEAKTFSTNYLKQVLAGREATNVDQILLGEVNSRHRILFL